LFEILVVTLDSPAHLCDEHELLKRCVFKLYVLHAPEIKCLVKRKIRMPFEFGVTVLITTTHNEGLVIGTRLMPRNPYD
jgi:hypothetical protein